MTLVININLALAVLGVKPESIPLSELLRSCSAVVYATYESDRVHSRGLVFAAEGARLTGQIVQLDIPMYRGDDVEAKISGLPSNAVLFLSRKKLKSAYSWKCVTMIRLDHGQAQCLPVENIHHRVIGWRVDELVDFPSSLLPPSRTSHMYARKATKAQLFRCISKALARSEESRSWHIINQHMPYFRSFSLDNLETKNGRLKQLTPPYVEAKMLKAAFRLVPAGEPAIAQIVYLDDENYDIILSSTKRINHSHKWKITAYWSKGKPHIFASGLKSFHKNQFSTSFDAAVDWLNVRGILNFPCVIKYDRNDVGPWFDFDPLPCRFDMDLLVQTPIH